MTRHCNIVTRHKSPWPRIFKRKEKDILTLYLLWQDIVTLWQDTSLRSKDFFFLFDYFKVFSHNYKRYLTDRTIIMLITCCTFVAPIEMYVKRTHARTHTHAHVQVQSCCYSIWITPHILIILRLQELLNNNNGHFYGAWSLARSRAQCAVQKAAEKCINTYNGQDFKKGFGLYAR